jgi:hypothetical protein
MRAKFQFFLLMTLPSLMFAGTDDNLGVKGVWDKISDWLSDGYVAKIVAAIFFVMGVMRAMQSILQFFVMLGFSVLILNASTIIGKLASATF